MDIYALHIHNILIISCQMIQLILREKDENLTSCHTTLLQSSTFTRKVQKRLSSFAVMLCLPSVIKVGLVLGCWSLKVGWI